MNNLQPCPFCGSAAKSCGGHVGGVTVHLVRCSNADCIASFKSVDPKVWNTRHGDDVSTKLMKVASVIGIDTISLDQLINAYMTIRADRIREDTERRAEYDNIRAQVAKQTADECRNNGWFSVERLREMKLSELVELLREE